MTNTSSILELEKELEEDLEKHLKAYLPEPIINSELILFNNSKILKTIRENNINKLSKNKTPYGFINPAKNEKKIPLKRLERLYNKLVFLTEIPKYNDSHIEEICNLRDEYIKLENSLEKGLQKRKRDIRNKIKDLSSNTFMNRDPDYFGEMILTLINNILKRPNFSGYSYKNEMKSLAIEHILKYTWRFAPYKQSKISGQYVSAFTYISTICFNAFVATINSQNKEIKKSKEDFMETQKFKYSSIKSSKLVPECSVVDKNVKIVNIKNKLIDEIKKIPLDSKDILVQYPENYKINMDEYKEITGYSDNNNINLSLERISIESN